MAMRGWRRIGIMASVVWFFGFGVFLWNQFVKDAVAPYAQDLKICSAIEEYSDEFWLGHCGGQWLEQPTSLVTNGWLLRGRTSEQQGAQHGCFRHT
jgi:hypothetical protein